jgi:predicted acylesterase/phospholipase RssA
MLPGGGALGAYHIGGYPALAGYNLPPDRVAGISIGAIDPAIIAGNRKAALSVSPHCGRRSRGRNYRRT